MFDYKNMLKRAIEFFPTWSDIRKRTKSSIGGQLLDSALKETLELESSINEYKDFYFLNKYDGIENTILTFVYKANIGKLQDLTALVQYKDKNYTITTDINEFYEAIDLIYYEDGYLYLKEELVDVDNLSLKLLLENFEYSYTMFRTNVWNIFDEYKSIIFKSNLCLSELYKKKFSSS